MTRRDGCGYDVDVNLAADARCASRGECEHIPVECEDEYVLDHEECFAAERGDVKDTEHVVVDTDENLLVDLNVAAHNVEGSDDRLGNDDKSKTAHGLRAEQEAFGDTGDVDHIIIENNNYGCEYNSVERLGISVVASAFEDWDVTRGVCDQVGARRGECEHYSVEIVGFVARETTNVTRRDVCDYDVDVNPAAEARCASRGVCEHIPVECEDHYVLDHEECCAAERGDVNDREQDIVHTDENTEISFSENVEGNKHVTDAASKGCDDVLQECDDNIEVTLDCKDCSDDRVNNNGKWDDNTIQHQVVWTAVNSHAAPRIDSDERLDMNTDDSRLVWSNRVGFINKQPTSESVPTCFKDPLVAEFASRVRCPEGNVWIDPMLVEETVVWNDILNRQAQQQKSGLVDEPASRSRRPRGRPKKSNPPPLPVHTPKASPVPKDLFEAQQTWEMAKMLGICSSDETAMIAGIRKSKRILAMEKMDT